MAGALKLVPTPDEVLVDQSAGGDAEAYEQLFRRHAAWAAQVCFRLTGRDDLRLEALVEQAFVETGRKASFGAGAEDFRTQLGRTLIHLCREYLSKHRRGIHRPVGLHMVSVEDDHLERFNERLQALGPDRAVPWLLRHVEGMSLCQVASLCAQSTSKTQRRLVEASRNLQSCDWLGLVLRHERNLSAGWTSRRAEQVYESVREELESPFFEWSSRRSQINLLHPRRRWTSAAGAGALLAMLMVAGFWWTADTTELELSGGTEITALEGAVPASVALDGPEGTVVHHTVGRALYRVPSHKHFTIASGGVRMSTQGGEFTIERDSSTVEVHVLAGEVALQSEEKSTRLRPGESLRVRLPKPSHYDQASP